MSVVYFFLLVGVLVVIHELGHFIAAKLLDFKVLRFSVGFGRALIRVRGRETEYQLALIPLGGYVRILGEDVRDDIPPEEARRAFNAQPLWRRLIVVFAGPAANLLLPVLIYFVFFAGHTHLPAAVVGDILPGGPAARAGIEPGDRVMAINGQGVRYWEEFEDAVQGNIGRELRLRLRRDERDIEKYLVPVEQVVRTRDGRATRQGFVGVTQRPFPPLVGIIDPGSPAARAGLQTGDLIISVNGERVYNWTELRPLLHAGAQRASIIYLRGDPMPGVGQVQLLEAAFANLVPETRHSATGRLSVYTGIETAEMFVAQVKPGSPADLTGLRPGDLITALDGDRMEHWMVLDQRLQARPDHTFTITWQRAEGDEVVTMSGPLKQVRKTLLDEYGHSMERLVFGARSDAERGRGELTPIRGRFGYAISKAIERTGETIGAMVSGFWSILGGRAPHESMGGPLMMYRVASVSGHKGWDSFLLMLALISVNLGLINLLPIPVLDGGHLLVFAVEAARRKPLSAAARARVQYVGLAMVGLITILALRNDVMRYIIN